MSKSCENIAEQTSKALREWYRGWLGRRVYDLEARAIEEACGMVHGHQMLIHGAYRSWPGLDNCPIPLRLVLDDGVSNPAGERALRGSIDEIPLPAEELSAVVLVHTLEIESDPYAVLREIDRVLMDDGYVVVVGFNPMSLWGLRRSLARGRLAVVPWTLPRYGTHRVKEWFSVLGFQVLRVDRVGAVLPLDIADSNGRLASFDHLLGRGFSALRGSYVMVARKRRLPLTPVIPAWRKPSNLIPAGLAEPSARDALGGASVHSVGKRSVH